MAGRPNPTSLLETMRCKTSCTMPSTTARPALSRNSPINRGTATHGTTHAMICATAYIMTHVTTCVTARITTYITTYVMTSVATRAATHTLATVLTNSITSAQALLCTNRHATATQMPILVLLGSLDLTLNHFQESTHRMLNLRCNTHMQKPEALKQLG